MTSQLNVDTIVDKAGSGGTNVKVANTSTYVSDGGAVTQNTVQGIAKGWIKFDGSISTPVAQDSFNHASLTDSSTGSYVNNVTNVFVNINYMMTTAGEHDGGHFASVGQFNHDQANTTSASKIDYHNTSATSVDVGNAGQVLHGDLA